ncbi:hypothetical protein GCM10008018_56120 [Paenibacillus marchantiophytorum]|uniref:Uncharacterized protein n=1 Tax=Paenibacillus marchantiophytorum TaxID=1619310 RepID=A0ABQ1F7V2_9BACL|nr:hypothetical protein [Paenibacillus marchantiophytorum]GGA02817.1 hypothetical protein GCM10008018_56120 [Paenibacillus marchantiophytorum]
MKFVNKMHIMLILFTNLANFVERYTVLIAKRGSSTIHNSINVHDAAAVFKII